MKIIEIENVSKTYALKGRNKGSVVKAVSNASLEIEEGEILGLLEIGRASCRERVLWWV